MLIVVIVSCQLLTVSDVDNVDSLLSHRARQVDVAVITYNHDQWSPQRTIA